MSKEKSQKEKDSKKRKQAESRSIGEKYDYEIIEGVYFMLDSGLDILSALEAISDDVESKSIKVRLDSAIQDISGGIKFWEVLFKYRLLPDRFVQIIKVGEENGILKENLGIVVEQYKHEKSLKGKVSSAMIYPIIILVVTTGVGLGVSWFVLPRMTTIYEGMGSELPALTLFLMGIGDFLQTNGYWFMPMLLGLFAVIFVIITFSKTVQGFLMEIIFRLPGFNALLSQVELSRMGFVLGNLLRVGITIDVSLEAIADAASIGTYQKLFKNLHTHVIRGGSINAFFRDNNISKRVIPTSVKRAITASERSGKLSETFLQIGQSYKDKIDITSQNLIVVLEPALLVMMWVFVAIIAIAVIMPMYSLISQF